MAPTQTKLIERTPPAALVKHCAALPGSDFGTVGDIVNDDQAVRKLYGTCSARHGALSSWAVS